MKYKAEENYKQDNIAVKLNISQNTYSKLELGYSTFNVARLIVIAEVLEIDFCELMYGPDNQDILCSAFE
jgi:transcriptional regulator with XRE-family HTH domain